MKKILLFIVAMLSVMQALAYDVFIESIFYNLNPETNEAEVTYCDSYPYSGSISIPSTITVDRIDMVKLGYDSENCEFNVTSIGNRAFADCTNLSSVSIPSSVKVISDGAFYDCSLSSITLPNSVTTIGNKAFYGCHFQSFTIPSSVTTIGDDAFQYCYDYRFSSITIPSSVTSIGSGVFSQCYGLTEIIVEDGNSVYDSRNGCNAIIETSTNKLIAGCKTTTIPNSVTSIGNEAFYGCDGVASITIPEGVTTIGNYAFSICRDLTEINLPISVTSIGSYAFYYSSNLSSVVSYIETPFSFGSMAFNGISADCKLTIPYGTSSAYTASGWTTSVFKGGFEEMESRNINMTSNGICTYSSACGLDFSGVSGLKAYIVSGFSPSAGTLVLTPVTEVPAGTGLLLKGSEGSYEVPYTTTDMYYSNLLTGVTTATEISSTSGDETNFILADGTHGINFYTLSEAGELAAGKAYLHLPTSTLSALSRVRGFTLIFDDEATGIEGIRNIEEDDNACYDLQGRRFSSPSKGIYITNGKKVFIK